MDQRIKFLILTKSERTLCLGCTDLKEDAKPVELESDLSKHKPSSIRSFYIQKDKYDERHKFFIFALKQNDKHSYEVFHYSFDDNKAKK